VAEVEVEVEVVTEFGTDIAAKEQIALKFSIS